MNCAIWKYNFTWKDEFGLIFGTTIWVKKIISLYFRKIQNIIMGFLVKKAILKLQQYISHEVVKIYSTRRTVKEDINKY